MHSKWQIWDFFSSYRSDTLNSYSGVLCLSTFDPICLKLVKKFLTSSLPDRVIHYKMASEVTKSWIEDEFLTLSLFGNTDSFFIHHANELHADLIELMLSLDIKERFLILSFENEPAIWKKIIKHDKVTTLTIEAPRFWEINKLLDFVCHQLRLPLSYEAKGWILDGLENNLASFYNSCCLLKLNFTEAREVNVSQVKELLTVEKLDQFQVASLIARKKKKDFYERLVLLQGDFDKMRGFFLFMQSHLIKMADTSYLSQKPRLTQYDKDLQNASKLWEEPELMELLSQFSRWEVLCKKKEPFIWHEIRHAYLRAISY